MYTQMRAAKAAVATLKPELEDAFMQEMKRCVCVVLPRSIQGPPGPFANQNPIPSIRNGNSRLDSSVWQSGSCDSYYITAVDRGDGGGSKGGGGRNDKARPSSDLTWPGTVVEYWRRTRKANLRRQFDVWGADGGRLWA